MTGRSSVAEALLRLAIRRWPPSLRDERGREWHAELAAVEGPSALRWYRRIRFAASLAVARPPEPAPGEPRASWREGWLGGQGVLGRLGLLLFVPLLGLLGLVPLVRLVSQGIASALFVSVSSTVEIRSRLLVEGLSAAAAAGAGLLLVVLAGRVLARRALGDRAAGNRPAGGRASGGRADPAGWRWEALAAQPVLAIGIVVAAVVGDRRLGLVAVNSWPHPVLVIGGAGVTGRLTLMVVGWLSRRPGPGRRPVPPRALAGLAVLSGLVVAELAVTATAGPSMIRGPGSPCWRSWRCRSRSRGRRRVHRGCSTTSSSAATCWGPCR